MKFYTPKTTRLSEIKNKYQLPVITLNSDLETGDIEMFDFLKTEKKNIIVFKIKNQELTKSLNYYLKTVEFIQVTKNRVYIC